MSKLIQRLVIFGVLMLSLHAQANIVINGTRVIYNAQENEATIRLNNVSSTPSLVQIWLDAGDMQSTPETGKSPFIATPPIFRVEPNRAQTVRIIYTPGPVPLPSDRESVFWLNVLDVPPMPVTKNAEDANYMQLAIRSRLKLFYRPKDLPGSATSAAAQVRWELVQKTDSVVLRATNDAVFHVSMDNATLQVADKNYTVNTEMLEPQTCKEFLVRELKTLPEQSAQLTAAQLNAAQLTAAQLNYATVNDFGSVVQHSIKLPY